MNIESVAPALARGSLRWYWNRLRVMSPLELPYRAFTALVGAKEKALHRCGLLEVAPSLTTVLPAPWLTGATHLPTVDAALYVREAELIAAGSVQRVDGGFFHLPAPLAWHTKRETQACELQDVRFDMELHRHGYWVRLAQAWRLTQNPAYLDALLRHLDSWLDQCPYPQGVAWASALDAGLRLLNWSIVWQLLQVGGSNCLVPVALRQRWVASVYVHARFIRQHRSRHSSANNHLLGELLGLVVAEATWPLWPDVLRWGASARGEFVVQALLQTHEDGVSCEQASWYQTFVFELFAVFVQIERTCQRSVDAQLLRRMGAMASFIAALRDRAGQLSHHGDADHAHVLNLVPSPNEPYAAMLALAVNLGVAPELQPLVKTQSVAGQWLLGSLPNFREMASLEHTELRVARSLLPRAFPHGGYHLLGSRFGESDEVLMVVDTGPLGYLSIAAHGHADALSVRLSVGGQPILVDRGTYCYNAQPRWRHFFRSTLAHNTVCVDGLDQSTYGGPFLWLRQAQTKLHSFASDDMAGHVDAEHNGYAVLAQKLTHRRRVEWHGTSRRFVVADTLQGRGAHRIAIAWHFDPACQVELLGEAAHIHASGISLLLRMVEPAAGQWHLYCGGDQEQLGWHSAKFGVREPAPSLVWCADTAATSVITTWIEIKTHEGRL
jgi:hypothetical protein